MKEKEIDEMGKKIELKAKKIKGLETEINNEKQLIDGKKNDKMKLEEECMNHEIRKRKRTNKKILLIIFIIKIFEWKISKSC